MTKNKESSRIAIIKPTFTAAAYQPRGFYDYYRGNCSTKCLTVPLVLERHSYAHSGTHKPHSQRKPLTDVAFSSYAASATTLKVLRMLALKNHTPIDVITDEQLTKDPSILNAYHKVVVLHNEYVSQAEFDVITHHAHVLYLFPNALYALVSYNQDSKTITLQKGHGYGGINNAFGWGQSMSTKDEYDTGCRNLRFLKVENGEVINCYPELVIRHDKHLLDEIKSRLFSN